LTLGLSGCFFFLPLDPEDENVPPSLVRASPQQASPVVVDEDGTVVYIIVSDPDDAEALTFVWSLEGEGLLPGALTIPDGPNRRASQIRLSPENRFGGAILTVLASDGFAENPSVEVSWEVVVDAGELP
jgi:hypothetical protein